MLHVDDQLSIPLREFKFSFSRSSGPGGQNVNKVNTRVTLRWSIRSSPSLSAGVRERFTRRYARRITVDGELVLTSQRFRDQGRNVGDCLEKLREMLAGVAVPPKPRKKTRPGKGAVERRLKKKREVSQRKQRRKPSFDD